MDKSVLQNRQLWLIFGITMIAVMGAASFMAAYPKMAIFFNVTPEKVAIISSIFTLPGLLFTPLFGMLADKIGRKKIIIPAMLLFAVAGFSIFFVRDYYLLLVLIFIQGVGASPLGALNVTLITDKFVGSDRSSALGFNGTIQSLSTTIYPIIGGALAGISWSYPFLMPLLSLIFLLPIVLFLKDDAPKTTEFSNYFASIRNYIRNKQVIAVFTLAILTFTILFGTLISFLPFLIVKSGIHSPTFIGMQISTMSIVAAITSSQLRRILNKLNPQIVLIFSFIFYGIGSASFLLFSNPDYFFISSAIFGLGHGVNIPTLISIISSLVPKENTAGFLSILRASSLLGQTGGPVLFGVFFVHFGLNSTFIFGSIFALIAIILIILFIKPIKIQ